MVVVVWGFGLNMFFWFPCFLCPLCEEVPDCKWVCFVRGYGPKQVKKMAAIRSKVMRKCK